MLKGGGGIRFGWERGGVSMWLGSGEGKRRGEEEKPRQASTPKLHQALSASNYSVPRMVLAPEAS